MRKRAFAAVCAALALGACGQAQPQAPPPADHLDRDARDLALASAIAERELTPERGFHWRDGLIYADAQALQGIPASVAQEFEQTGRPDIYAATVHDVEAAIFRALVDVPPERIAK